ncbi:MAG TPA: glutamate racemase [Aliicoccus persicus]|uniref:Glutamate racemase n=1 Tax=Aliicoccus persicus TaxID=930138 RepID=A0A921DY94_9STAP|nr:glutamate racemase [Aliicoccus persicus]
MNNQPIGILDSGVGGLTVTQTLLRELSNESFIYVADMKGYPYGDKTLEEAQTFILKATDFLYDQGVKMIVFACNTATAAAIEVAKRRYPIPVIGVIEPTARLASRTTTNNQILLLATESTVKSNYYAQEINRINPDIRVISKGCSTFAPFIESGGYHDRVESLLTIDNEINGYKDTPADTIILGCTHYPMLRETLEEYFNHSKTFVDSSNETLKDIQFILSHEDLYNDSMNVTARLHVYLTAESKTFESILNEWLPNEKYSLNVIEL